MISEIFRQYVFATYERRRAHRFIKKEQVEAKLVVCDPCPQQDGHTCKRMGCRRDTYVSRILDPMGRCPLKLWELK